MIIYAADHGEMMGYEDLMHHQKKKSDHEYIAEFCEVLGLDNGVRLSEEHPIFDMH